MENKQIWSKEHVIELNKYQREGKFHPYTCGNNRTDENHLDGEGLLVATIYGWICPFCDYKQGWAHNTPIIEAKKEEPNKKMKAKPIPAKESGPSADALGGYPSIERWEQVKGRSFWGRSDY